MMPRRSTKTRPEPLTMISETSSSLRKWAMGLRKGMMRSKLIGLEAEAFLLNYFVLDLIGLSGCLSGCLAGAGRLAWCLSRGVSGGGSLCWGVGAWLSAAECIGEGGDWFGGVWDGWSLRWSEEAVGWLGGLVVGGSLGRACGE